MRLTVRAPLLLAALVVAASSSAACSKDEPTPAEARRNRLETRLEASFSDAQVRCILAKLDDPTIQALDRTANLPPGAALNRYSDAVQACVADPATTTSTPSTPSTPAGTSSTAATSTAATVAGSADASTTTTPAASSSSTSASG